METRSAAATADRQRRRHSERPAPVAPAPGPAPAPIPGRMLSVDQVLQLQRTVGNAATQRVVRCAACSAATDEETGSPCARNGLFGPIRRNPDGGAPAATGTRLAFVREEGLNLRAGPDPGAPALAQMPFGQRVRLLDDPNPTPGWQKIAIAGHTGYGYAPRLHAPPATLVDKDPALRLIKVPSGQTFWGLVKSVYGIHGNEGTADQNINHFINAIRAVNKPQAFKVKEGTLDKLGNAIIAGRDASDTELIAGVDLWIPSFGVAAAMDVGSGTVSGEITRIVKKIEQKIEDFGSACMRSGKYIPGAIAKNAGEVGTSLLKGLIDFALDAARILAISTAVGALIGALFGGVGAIPGAEIGFEIGLIILDFYGLAMLVEAILGVAGQVLSRLGSFVSLAWSANGDEKQLEEAGKTLADALGLLVAAALVAFAAYVTKKGVKALRETKFAKTVGETQLAQWIEKRGQMATTEKVAKGERPGAPAEPVKAGKGEQPGKAEPVVPGSPDKLVICRVCDIVPGVPKDLMDARAKLSVEARQLLDKRAAKFFPDPANPTPEGFKGLRGFMEGTAKKGGGDLEAGLRKLMPKVPPVNPPHGPAVGHLPRVRGEIEKLITDIEDYAKANPDKATITTSAERLRQQLDGPVKRMETGVEAATDEQVKSVERAIKGGHGELERAKAAPSGTVFGDFLEDNETDQIRPDGTLVQVKKMRALRRASRTYNDTVAQIKATLELAKKHPVGGQPRQVIIEFPEGLSKEVKGDFEAIEVDGRKAKIEAKEIIVPPK